MKFGHIVTVGTSLITNTGGTGSGCQERQQALRGLERACSGLGDNVNGASIEERRRRAKTSLLGLKPEQEFGYRPSQHNEPKDRLPQELSYLWRFANGGYKRSQCSQQDMVRLLSSDTNDAKNCSLIICDALQNPPWEQWYTATFDVNKDFAEGVDAERGDLFRTTGIQKWMENIQEMVEELKGAGCDRIFLNVTGGYKGTVPYSTLMGMLRRDKVEVVIAYLFEESPEIIFMPVYPVGLDFRQWHENALRLRMAQEPSGTAYFIPDLPVRELLQPKQSLSAFGRELEKQYEKQLSTDPLKVYSRNIITRLLHESGPWVGGEKPEGAGNAPKPWDSNEVGKLRKILHNLVDKVGDIIWLGDKIPEMVEHAQRHHHDLLEFTELFLTPILYHQPDFLNARERFVLLSAVMLHDSGHSLDCISVQACKDLAGLFSDVSIEGLGGEIPLFPNDVRAYHQYLASIRLNDKDMAADLGWPGRECLKKKGLPEMLHDAVILACLYHRRRMDYDMDSRKQKGKLHLTGQWPGPLVNKAAHFKQNCNVDLMKVVALLRLVDGCDSQARRAGPRARVDLTLSLLKRDYRTAAMRAEQAYKAFQDGPSCANKCKWASKLVTHPWELKDGEREIRIECLKTPENSGSGPEQKQCARLWLMAAEAADRAQMRFGQFAHFMKHRAVTEIRVLPADDFSKNNLTFNVVLVPNSDSTKIRDPRNPSRCGTVKDFWLHQCLFPDDDLPLSKTIEEEVCSEYDQVAEYATKKWGLKAAYWWEDDWNRRDSNGKPFYTRLKIITHKNPDFDVIGFVFSARKKFGHDTVFELVDAPSLQQLNETEIIVGDVGAKSHPKLGYEPSLNNFDHHYGAAERSATYLFNQVHHALAEKVVHYIDEVDTAKSTGKEQNSLKVVIAGIRVIYQGEDRKIIEEGCKVLDWIEATNADPYHLTSLPPHIESHLQGGLQEIERIEKEIEACEVFASKKNRMIGYLISSCPVKSLVKEEMFARGFDIGILHYPSKQAFSIGCCIQAAKDVDLEKEVASALNHLEQKKGMSKEYTWGGHPDRIGSPKQRGSLLTKDEVVEVIQHNL